MDKQQINAEFDRQCQTLVDKGYPALAGVSPDALRHLVEPLRDDVVARAVALQPPTRARVPFVLVVDKKLAPPSETMPLTELKGRPGFVSGDTADIDLFEPIDSVDVPARDAYAVFDIERGKDTLNVSPDDAMPTLEAEGRSPLTVEEGIAFITHHPGSLEKNNCFQLLASRRDDRRVPGLWISQQMPKLGFCWAGNHHTWLGAASCAARTATQA